MKSLKFIAIAILAVGYASTAFAQEPDEHHGKWKIVAVQAVDSTGAVLADETASVQQDFLTDHTIEFEFGASTFTLHVDGAVVGTCTYYIAPVPGTPHGDFVFDEDGDAFSGIAYKLRGKTIVGTTLYIDAHSPDINSGIIYQEELELQP